MKNFQSCVLGSVTTLCVVLLLFYGYGQNAVVYDRKQVDASLELSKHIPIVKNELNVSSVINPMEDPENIRWLREVFLMPPSKEKYNLNTKQRDTSMGQAKFVNSLLHEMKGGFFVECGALDGETRSNTLFFERELGWNGLLIEADPLNYKKALRKHRHAYLSNTCLSLKPEPTLVTFQQRANLGRIAQKNVPYSGFASAKVQCFPFLMYLLALNIKTVHYFSLDIEGDELEVLKTIPFDKIDVWVLSVEFIHGKEGKSTLRNYMLNQGYYVAGEVTHPGMLANDFIFAKKDLDKKLRGLHGH